MENHLREKFNKLVEDKVMKENLVHMFEEKILNRKAMFIPILGVATFMLVGYAAADTKAPEINTQNLEVAYGEKFDVDAIDISDNRDSRDSITVEANTASLDVNQLGEYKVDVVATDSFNNQTTKTITVSVVDQVGPEFNTLGSSEGYVVEVPVHGSTDLSSYIVAYDNVDGDVTPFITTDKALDTSHLGTQTITLEASDTSGNKTEKTLEFAITDTEAPKINLKKGADVTARFGVAFNLAEFVEITDNYDQSISPKVEGSIDVNKENEKRTLNITATDTSGNTSTATLNVTVKDEDAPVITLTRNEISVKAGTSVNFAQYLRSATDNKDGDLKAKVSIPTVRTSKAGTYSAVYSVTDSSGNKGTATLQVKVTKASSGIGSSSRPNYYGTSVVGAAYSRLGCPYKWGAAGPNAFDCSGLVQWCYAKAGKSLPHSSGALASCGTKVSISSAQPGDILWRPGHVGIYIGGGKYIHAPHTGDVVKISSGASSFSYAVRP
ncbi:MAG: NlpC/P60 family protein [Faecalibacillus sp.]